MNDPTIGLMVIPGYNTGAGILLVESLRRFGGALAGMPVDVLVPTGYGELSGDEHRRFGKLAVSPRSFELSAAYAHFPFAAKVAAAAVAEQAAAGSGSFVWMDTESLILAEPWCFHLPAGTNLAYRPVDHTLIGSRLAQPPDAFWSSIYEDCGVPADSLFSMTASVDGETLRPYFNAGLLVVDPRVGLLRAWHSTFDRLYTASRYKEFYERDHLYAVFMHQAVLAGVLLASCRPVDMVELPHQVSYPLHMHGQYPEALRPARLNDLMTCRYESFFTSPDWRGMIAVEEPLDRWLSEHF
ncbi:hypothetical protein JW905_10325 [bacterium]|nr:hypothetical protein [candidate division CSSED10-310 bacterium]